MSHKINVTTTRTVWAEGEWGRGLTLKELETFIKEAREIGFTDRDAITVNGGSKLTLVKMHKVEGADNQEDIVF